MPAQLALMHRKRLTIGPDPEDEAELRALYCDAEAS
jgi:hypothetical protein